MGNDATVKIAQGELVGRARGGVRQWLGIPYATAKRFGPPEAPSHWQGKRDAGKMAPQCPQTFGK